MLGQIDVYEMNASWEFYAPLFFNELGLKSMFWGSLCIILKTEDWPNLKKFSTEDFKIQFLRFGYLKTALLCLFYSRYQMLKTVDLSGAESPMF